VVAKAAASHPRVLTADRRALIVVIAEVCLMPVHGCT
jgi:hypothetical protein